MFVRIDDDSVLESDYLERLVNLWNHLQEKKMKVGAVGGIVPTMGTPRFSRDTPQIFNRLEFSSNTKFTMGDDGGYSYEQKSYVPSHHLRSSFLFSRKAAAEAGNHPEHLGLTGFREETVLSFKMLMKGYKLYTDTGAVAWHNRASTGGTKTADYAEQVKRCDDWFYNWVLKNKPLLEENLGTEEL